MALQSPLAISMGEPAGIGPDLIVSLFARREELSLPPFIVFGNAALLKARAERLGIEIETSEPIAADATSQFAQCLPVINFGTPMADAPGTPSRETAKPVMDYISGAVRAVMTGACRGLVTAPINKAVLKRGGFAHPGHTEFLGELCSSPAAPVTPVMMLTYASLRVVPLTIHVPLADVPGLITPQRIVTHVRVVARDLKARFGIGEPNIAITGLNPHAGEDGEIGRDEIERIRPAIVKLVDEGISVTGPLPADTVFHPPNWKKHDAVVAMYHDQALIPIKTVAFDEAVNVTLGLPLIRTSPDHGTAFDLAGTGKASDKSMLAAIRLADEMSREKAAEAA